MAKRKRGGGKKRKSPKFSKKQNDLIDEATVLIREALEDELGEDTHFENYEEKGLEIANEILRRELERKLQKLADGFPKRLVVGCQQDSPDWPDALRYRRHLRGRIAYHSLVGPLRVGRYTYREIGGVCSCVPLDLTAGLIQRMTPGLARCVASGAAEVPSRKLKQLLVDAGRRPPSRSTIERCAKDLGDRAVDANASIEPQVRCTEMVPREAKAIVLGLDRASVPMRPNHPSGGWQGFCQSRPSPVSLSGYGAVQWRMDYVGTVAFVDRNGDKVQGREYRAPADSKPSHLARRLRADLRQALAWRPDLKVAVVQDGAPELWKCLRSVLQRESAVVWTEILDWYHLSEHLAACAEVCRETPKDRTALRKRWEGGLLAGLPMSSITRSIERSAAHIDADSKQTLDTHVRYFQRNALRTAYADYKKLGLPIGSGTTEGACKSLVQARAKKSGQRWSQRGLTAILHLRAVKESDRFDSYWPLFAQRYRAKSITPLRG